MVSEREVNDREQLSVIGQKIKRKSTGEIFSSFYMCTYITTSVLKMIQVPITYVYF